MSGATIQLWLAALLALASLLAVPGLLRRRRELARWQWSALLLAQPALAGLLYLSLYPPLQALEPQVLTVLGAGCLFKYAIMPKDLLTTSIPILRNLEVNNLLVKGT